MKEVLSAVADRLWLLIGIIAGGYVAQYVLPTTTVLIDGLVILAVAGFFGLVGTGIDHFSAEEDRDR